MGIEPTFLLYESSVLPLNYIGKYESPVLSFSFSFGNDSARLASSFTDGPVISTHPLIQRSVGGSERVTIWTDQAEVFFAIVSPVPINMIGH